ncbi:MAG: hypothetical protein ACK5X3_19540, partial [Pseudomonadota bacterium]
MAGQTGIEIHREFQHLARDIGGDDGRAALDDVLQTENTGGEFHAPGFDLGKIKQAIHEFKQM